MSGDRRQIKRRQYQRRQQQRISLRHAVTAYDMQTGGSLGLVVNLTQDGIMLVNNRQLKQNRRYSIRLEVASELLGTEIATQINVEADCLWISPATEVTNMYWAGCQIVSISDLSLALLQQVLESAGD